LVVNSLLHSQVQAYTSVPSARLMLAFTIITGIASILGLGFSIAAWLEAREAASAAKEARKAVRKSNAAEVLKDLNRNASELLAFIQADQYQAAGVRARDLFTQIRTAKSRWERFLAAEAAENLDDAQSKVKKISNALASHEVGPSAGAKQKLMQYAHAVVGILSEESGKIVGRIEAEEE
jgi:biopolymer transport protein ExbB/TolQ